MKNGKLVATLGAVALVAAIGAGSTLAYLTAGTNTVTNTFTLGNVTFDETLGNGLMEKNVVKDGNEYKFAPTKEGKIWVTSNKYEALYPGQNVVKNPTVFLTETSEDAWVFAKVTYDKDLYTINFSDEWTDVTKAYADATKKDTKGYVVLAKNTKILKSVKGDETSEIFSDVTVSDELEADQTMSDIVIDAFAIQASGFKNNTDALAEVVFE